MDSPKNTFQERVMGKSEPKICNWTFDDDYGAYDTQCGETFCFIDDGIKANHFKYCPYCGGIIVEAKSNE